MLLSPLKIQAGKNKLGKADDGTTVPTNAFLSKLDQNQSKYNGEISEVLSHLYMELVMLKSLTQLQL